MVGGPCTHSSSGYVPLRWSHQNSLTNTYVEAAQNISFALARFRRPGRALPGGTLASHEPGDESVSGAVDPNPVRAGRSGLEVAAVLLRWADWSWRVLERERPRRPGNRDRCPRPGARRSNRIWLRCPLWTIAFTHALCRSP